LRRDVLFRIVGFPSSQLRQAKNTRAAEVARLANLEHPVYKRKAEERGKRPNKLARDLGAGPRQTTSVRGSVRKTKAAYSWTLRKG